MVSSTGKESHCKLTCCSQLQNTTEGKSCYRGVLEVLLLSYMPKAFYDMKAVYQRTPHQLNWALTHHQSLCPPPCTPGTWSEGVGTKPHSWCCSGSRWGQAWETRNEIFFQHLTPTSAAPVRALHTHRQDFPVSQKVHHLRVRMLVTDGVQGGKDYCCLYSFMEGAVRVFCRWNQYIFAH